MKLQRIYEAKDELDASLILGYLESYGIKAVINQSTVNMPPMFSGDARSTVAHLVPRDIFVPEEAAEEALKLIHEVRN